MMIDGPSYRGFNNISTLRRVDQGRQPFRSHGSVGVGADGGDLAPIDLPVESNADPPPAPNVRWSEEAIGFGVDQLGLRSGWRRAPQMREVVIMVDHRATTSRTGS